MTVQVVSFHCVLKNKFGDVIGTTFNQNVINDYYQDQTSLTALVDGLRDLKKGEKRKIFLNAERAYGHYNPSLVIQRRYDEIYSNKSEPIKVGERVVFVTDGKQHVFRVINLTPETVTLDGNHPLAGQDLVFEIEATEAREATDEEIRAARIKNNMICHSSDTVH